MYEWIHLVAVEPDTHYFHQFKNGEFVAFEPLQQTVESVSDIATLIESHQENFPVYFIN